MFLFYSWQQKIIFIYFAGYVDSIMFLALFFSFKILVLRYQRAKGETDLSYEVIINQKQAIFKDLLLSSEVFIFNRPVHDRDCYN